MPKTQLVDSRFETGWATCAAQRLRPQYEPISHPQKIPSKYWILKIRGKNSKERDYSRSRLLVSARIMLLRSSDYSSPKEKGYCQIKRRIHGIRGPHRRPPNQSRRSYSAISCGHWQPPCPSRPGPLQESLRGVSEPLSPNESQSPERQQNSVSTDNPKA